MSEAIVEVYQALKPEDLKAANCLVKQVIAKYFGCEPPSPVLLPVVFVARLGNNIVGSMTLQFATADEQFALEDVYNFQGAQTPWPFERENIAVFGRWAATQPFVALGTMYAATAHAAQNKKLYALTELKPHSAAVVQQRFGYDIHYIRGHILKLENIPQAALGYYLTPPISQPCMLELSHMLACLQPLVDAAVSSGFLRVFVPQLQAFNA